MGVETTVGAAGDVPAGRGAAVGDGTLVGAGAAGGVGVLPGCEGAQLAAISASAKTTIRAGFALLYIMDYLSGVLWPLVR